jgi:hypothetical protein
LIYVRDLFIEILLETCNVFYLYKTCSVVLEINFLAYVLFDVVCILVKVFLKAAANKFPFLH